MDIEKLKEVAAVEIVNASDQIEYFGLTEIYGEDLDEAEIKKVYDLIISAKIRVSWEH